MKNALRILVPLSLVILVGATWLAFRARPGDDLLQASGTVEATTADLGFELPGRIATLAVREGDPVSAGDELAALDLTQLQAQADAARAQLEAAQARLRELRSGTRDEEIRTAEAASEAALEREEEALRETQRARRLFEGGAISQQALDRAETQLVVAAASTRQAREHLALARKGPRVETIQAQEALVAQARAQLARVEATLANGVVTAPFTGVVTVRHREPGEIVPAGAPVVTILDRSDRWVRIYVPENAIGRVSLGQAAEIRSDTWPDRAYEGSVSFIGSEAEFTPRNVQTSEERTRLVYPVKVRIEGDPDFELKPGVPADVVLLEGAPAASSGGER